MSSTGKAGLTVSLLFVGPLVLVVCMLFAARDDRPNAAVAPQPEPRIAQEAPRITNTCSDQICSDIQDQKYEEQRVRAQEEYRADQQLDERIRDAANAAANAAVKNAMSEKPG
jgi:hypothetical protein